MFIHRGLLVAALIQLLVGIALASSGNVTYTPLPELCTPVAISPNGRFVGGASCVEDGPPFLRAAVWSAETGVVTYPDILTWVYEVGDEGTLAIHVEASSEETPIYRFDRQSGELALKAVLEGLIDFQLITDDLLIGTHRLGIGEDKPPYVYERLEDGYVSTQLPGPANGPDLGMQWVGYHKDATSSGDMIVGTFISMGSGEFSSRGVGWIKGEEWTVELLPLECANSNIHGVMPKLSPAGDVLICQVDDMVLLYHASGNPTTLIDIERIVDVSDSPVLVAGNNDDYGVVWSESFGVMPIADILTSAGLEAPVGNVVDVSSNGRDILLDTRADAVIMHLPLVGDSNNDEDVNFLDFLNLAGEFGTEGKGLFADFNYDQRVDFGDFLILSDNFSKGASVASVPEPYALELIGAVLFIVFGCHHFSLRRASRMPGYSLAGTRNA